MQEQFQQWPGQYGQWFFLSLLHLESHPAILEPIFFNSYLRMDVWLYVLQNNIRSWDEMDKSEIDVDNSHRINTHQPSVNSPTSIIKKLSLWINDDDYCLGLYIKYWQPLFMQIPMPQFIQIPSHHGNIQKSWKVLKYSYASIPDQTHCQSKLTLKGFLGNCCYSIPKYFTSLFSLYITLPRHMNLKMTILILNFTWTIFFHKHFRPVINIRILICNNKIVHHFLCVELFIDMITKNSI